MGNRSKCKSAGSFGAKKFIELEGAIRMPKSVPQLVKDRVATLKTLYIVGVVRPNRGRNLWKNQLLARKGHRGVKYSKVMKDAQKQTTAAKARDAAGKIDTWKKNPVAFAKAVFQQRKGSA